jgi:hypothetical protein
VIIAIAGTFLISPPLLQLNDDSRVVPLTKFIIVGIMALMFIPLKAKSKKEDYKFWYRTAWITFILVLVIVPVYIISLSNLSVRHYHGRSLVIGRTMFSDAVKRKTDLARELSRTSINNETFVKASKGETFNIWPEAEIKNHFYYLSILYVASFILVGTFIIIVIQSIYCYEAKE